MTSVKNTSNIMRIEGAETVWEKTPKYVRLIQWVDDNGDIADDSTLVISLNGVSLTTKLQLEADISNYGVVVWQMGPFNPGVAISDFIVTTMATGHLHIWID